MSDLCSSVKKLESEIETYLSYSGGRIDPYYSEDIVKNLKFGNNYGIDGDDFQQDDSVSQLINFFDYYLERCISDRYILGYILELIIKCINSLYPFRDQNRLKAICKSYFVANYDPKRVIGLLFSDSISNIPFWAYVFDEDSSVDSKFYDIHCKIQEYIRNEPLISAPQFLNFNQIELYCSFIERIKTESIKINWINALIIPSFRYSVTKKSIDDNTLYSYYVSITKKSREFSLKLIQSLNENDPNMLCSLFTYLALVLKPYISEVFASPQNVSERGALSIIRFKEVLQLFHKYLPQNDRVNTSFLILNSFSPLPIQNKALFMQWMLVVIQVENLSYQISFDQFIRDSNEKEAILLSLAGHISIVLSCSLLGIDITQFKNETGSLLVRNKRMNLIGEQAKFVSSLNHFFENPQQFEIMVFGESIPLFVPRFEIFHNNEQCSSQSFIATIIDQYPVLRAKILNRIVSRLMTIKRCIYNINRENDMKIAKFLFEEAFKIPTDQGSDSFFLHFSSIVEIIKSIDSFDIITVENREKIFVLESLGLFSRNPLIQKFSLNSIVYLIHKFLPDSMILFPYYFISLKSVSDKKELIEDICSLIIVFKAFLDKNSDFFCSPQNGIDFKSLLIPFSEPNKYLYEEIKRITEGDYFSNILSEISGMMVDLVTNYSNEQSVLNLITILFCKEIFSGILSNETMSLLSILGDNFSGSSNIDGRIFSVIIRLIHHHKQHDQSVSSTIHGILMKILTNSNTTDYLFQSTIDNLVDLLAPSHEQDKSVFDEDIQSLEMLDMSSNKQLAIENAINQYLVLSNRGSFLSHYAQKAPYYSITNGNTLHSILPDNDSIRVLSKTANSSSYYEISFDQKCRDTKESDELKLDQFQSSFSSESGIEKSFNNSIEKMDKKLSKLFSPSDFDQFNIDSMIQIPEFNPEIEQKSLPSTNGIGLISSPLASSLHQSLFKGSYEEFKSYNLFDITVNNVFSLCPRENMKIGVLYVSQGQYSQNDILKNEWKDTSKEFKSFVCSLGMIVDLSNHHGYSGKLDTQNFTNGRYQVYFESNRYEVMFHVAPLMPLTPNNDQQIYKKRHIGNDNIHIVWCENSTDYDPMTITSQFNDAHIIIYPNAMFPDLYRVNVFRKSQMHNFGPLFGDIYISKEHLPSLAIWTSICADRIVRSSSQGFQTHYQMFQTEMEKLVELIPPD